MGSALVWVVGIVGGLIVVGSGMAIARVDQYWIPRVRHCCVCRRRWVGIDKLCNCGGRGKKHLPPEHRVPDHDWQGHMNTGPIPIPAQRAAFDFDSLTRPS